MALKVQLVLGAWREFDLNKTQQQIDESATEITANQDESDASRKKLVDLSKDFKKNTPEDVRKQVAPLLKSFQTEVDNLTKRSKFAEISFLNVYKSIIEITDPVPSLEYCIGLEKKLGRYVDLEIENKNLRETMREYNEEFKEIRNQDVTIKNLKEKVKLYEDSLNDSVSNKFKELEMELQTQYADKERILQERQRSVMRRVEEAESRAVILQQTLEQTQSELFEYKSKSDEFTAAHSETTNILAIDLERSNQRVLQAEKEVATLQDQLNNAAEGTGSVAITVAQLDANAEMMARSSLEVELSVKDKEIVQLVGDVKNLQGSLQQFRMESEKKLLCVEEQLEKKTATADELKDLLEKQVDYQEIKRELAIIKSVEFGANADAISLNQDDVQRGKPLELLLMEKNKSLQNENTVIKQANLDLTKHISESNHEVSSLRTLTSEQKLLISQLESDLASMQSFSSVYRGEGEGCPSMPEMVAEAVKGTTAVAGDELVGIMVERELVDGRDSVSSLARSVSVASTPLNGSNGDVSSAQSAAESLLPIVSAQRERFKARNDELEADIAAKSQHVTILQNEVDTLRTDNVKLYEKIRFLQSYRGEHSNKASNAEARYVGQYEESLDPFASFSRKEKQRRYSALSPFEKMTLALGRFILSNKTARTVTFIYTTILHCLIFLVLYKLAHTESCKRDLSVDCAQRFADHMHHVHGELDFLG
uniref:Protein CASP n=1 Tax=Hirondellea gigas TaxID=1518452 RepID=A0A2P2I5R5_9CRUS